MISRLLFILVVSLLSINSFAQDARESYFTEEPSSLYYLMRSRFQRAQGANAQQFARQLGLTLSAGSVDAYFQCTRYLPFTLYWPPPNTHSGTEYDYNFHFSMRKSEPSLSWSASLDCDGLDCETQHLSDVSGIFAYLGDRDLIPTFYSRSGGNYSWDDLFDGHNTASIEFWRVDDQRALIIEEVGNPRFIHGFSRETRIHRNRTPLGHRNLPGIRVQYSSGEIPLPPVMSYSYCVLSPNQTFVRPR